VTSRIGRSAHLSTDLDSKCQAHLAVPFGNEVWSATRVEVDDERRSPHPVREEVDRLDEAGV